MAAMYAQRAGNTCTLSLHLFTRSRALALTVSSTERTRQFSQRSQWPPTSSYFDSHADHQPRSSRYRPFWNLNNRDSTHPEYQTSAGRSRGSSKYGSFSSRNYATTAASTSSATRAQPGAATSSSAAPSSSPSTGTRYPGTSASRPAAATTNTRSAAQAASTEPPVRDLSESGLLDDPAASPASLRGTGAEAHVDWTSSFHGLSAQSFSKEAQEILMQSIDPNDIEIKPDGIIYLPEIKYRRILNRAFGPGGWGLAPRSETIVTSKAVTREYALVAHGRLVSIARGEQDYFDTDGIPTASEGCKSNALMRCCKDLGVASELWDPRFIRKFLAQHGKEVWVEHVSTKKKRKITLRRDDEVRYPFKESKPGL